MTNSAIPPRSVDATTSRRMSRQRTRDTEPEMLLRRELHRRGLRYRVDVSIPGLPRRRADLLFTPAKVAVFVDGCFWHGCPVHGRRPLTNGPYWRLKIEKNIARDVENTRILGEHGWHVVRIWEHDDLDCAAKLLRVDVLRRRSRAPR